MSRAATDWAWGVTVKPATLKLILLSMSDRADEIHECFPSIARLVKDTGLNQKTVQQGLLRMIEMGLISDTGKRKGPTGRVRVFQLNLSYKSNDPKNGNVTENGVLNDPENGVLNDPENGVQNQSLEPVIESFTPSASCNRPSASNGSGGEAVNNKRKTPPCPTNKIIELYHQSLPELPELKVITETRRRQIQTRWRENPQRQNLEFWERYFNYVRQSNFLMGNAEGYQGKTPFRADLEWLTKLGNFVKVIEGKYHND